MISRFWKKAAFLACFAGLLFFCAAGALAAQSPTASIHGQVTDPSGAAVTGVTVLLTTPPGVPWTPSPTRRVSTSSRTLRPAAMKSRPWPRVLRSSTKSGIALGADQSLRVNLPLALEVQQEKVLVNDTTTQVDVNPTNNANTIVLQGKDLEALSDDPDELESELQALAGPSAGPNGGQIYIDGFTAGQLPPKASIREIRINQNPFSSEYDRLGYGRVEIFTKPARTRSTGSS